MTIDSGSVAIRCDGCGRYVPIPVYFLVSPENTPDMKFYCGICAHNEKEKQREKEKEKK
jgi:hypothetical protein